MNQALINLRRPDDSGSLPERTNIYGARILIVGDEVLSVQFLEGILHRQGFTNTRVAAGGDSAFPEIDRYDPDLVLLDVEMPDKSGIGVCRRVRRDARFAELPILIQTAAVDQGDVDALFSAGATDFLSKPVSAAELISRVTLHLERRKLLRDLQEYRRRTSLELGDARRMQTELLPHLTQQQRVASASGVRMSSFLRSSSEIGGDLWGLIPLGDASFGIFLADFAGHGVTAALNTFRLHALIHEHCDAHRAPQELLTKLNRRLVELLSPGQFATFVYAVIEPHADRICIASAGAPPLVIAPGWGAEAALADHFGLPLGVSARPEYEVVQRDFPPGSTLLLFSDGLSEKLDAHGNRLGDDGVLRLLRRCSGLPPDRIVAQLCDIAEIESSDALEDDVTIVCLDRPVDHGGKGKQR